MTLQSLLDAWNEALKQVKKLHHDVGFMWHLTSGANYRLTGNEDSLTRNFFAATSHFSRYNITGDYIRAWNGNNVSQEEGRRYTQEAINILKACDEHFCNYEENEDALVLMGTERYPHNENEMRGLHIPIIYGVFFFVEALCKLKGRDFLIW